VDGERPVSSLWRTGDPRDDLDLRPALMLA
jgi:hypothetical protein